MAIKTFRPKTHSLRFKTVLDYKQDLTTDQPHKPLLEAKQRISGRHGHLSNAAARELLESITSPRWRHVFLTHLSRDCNSPAAVEAACGSILAARGCSLSVVAAGGGTPLFEF